jgi:hypothetical protein
MRDSLFVRREGRTREERKRIRTRDAKNERRERYLTIRTVLVQRIRTQGLWAATNMKS